MPPKKTSTRLDITLPISLVEMLRAHADREGLTVSSVIGQAVRAHLEGPAPSPSSAHQMTLPSDIDSLISQRVEAALQEHLSRLPAPVTPEIPVPVAPAPELSGDPVSEPARVTVPVKRSAKSGPASGKVEIPADVLKKAQIFKAAAIENTIISIFNPERDPAIETIKKGTIQGFVKGTARTTDPEYLKQVTKALEVLEGQQKEHSDLSTFN